MNKNQDSNSFSPRSPPSLAVDPFLSPIQLAPRSPFRLTPPRPPRPTAEEIENSKYFLAEFVNSDIKQSNSKHNSYSSPRVHPPQYFTHRSKKPKTVANYLKPDPNSSVNLLEQASPPLESRVQFSPTTPKSFRKKEFLLSPEAYWSSPRSENLLFEKYGEQEKGMMMEKVNSWESKGGKRKWKFFYTLYTLQYLLSLLLTLFFDLNIIYILTQLILYPSLPSVPATPSPFFFAVEIPKIHTSTAWLVALSLYCLVVITEYIFILSQLVRFLRMFRGSRIPLGRIYNSSSSWTFLGLHSSRWLRMLVKLRYSSWNVLGMRDCIIQSCDWFSQNWVRALLHLFRGVIAFIILLLYSGLAYSFTTTANLVDFKDPTYFALNGTLSRYAAVLLLVFCALCAARILLVIVAFALRWLLSTSGGHSIALAAAIPSSLSSDSLELRSFDWKDRRDKYIIRFLQSRSGSDTPLFGCAETEKVKRRRKNKRGSLSNIYWSSPISNASARNLPPPISTFSSPRSLPPPISISTPGPHYKNEMLTPSSPIDLSFLTFPQIGKSLPPSTFSPHTDTPTDSPSIPPIPFSPLPQNLPPTSPLHLRTSSQFSQLSAEEKEPKELRNQLLNSLLEIHQAELITLNPTLKELHLLIKEMSRRNSSCEEELEAGDILDGYFEEEGSVTPTTFRGLGIIEAEEESGRESGRESELRFSAGTFGSN